MFILLQIDYMYEILFKCIFDVEINEKIFI